MGMTILKIAEVCNIPDDTKTCWKEDTIADFKREYVCGQAWETFNKQFEKN